MKIIENYDYILSVGAFFEDEEFRNSLKKAIKNSAIFIYMHPIDNFELKDFYDQFIKYEVASEEAILALIFGHQKLLLRRHIAHQVPRGLRQRSQRPVATVHQHNVTVDTRQQRAHHQAGKSTRRHGHGGYD